LLRNYLEKYALKSSKYNDYKDWCEIIEKNNSSKEKLERTKLARKIKSGKNSKRTVHSFKH
jgi:hypothetical protein